MSINFSHQVIADRGGNLCGEDRFCVQACASCQGQYLYNAELKDVYYDPEDLARHFFKIPGMDLPPCRYCGQLNWRFADTAPDQQQVQAGPWAWALQSRRFTFDGTED